MATNTENISCVNSFIKGMNSDMSTMTFDSNTYAEARNIRILATANQGSTSGSNEGGELRPIEGIQEAFSFSFNDDDGEGNPVQINIKNILATGNVRKYGVIVVQTEDNDIFICRFTNKIGYPNCSTNEFAKINDFNIIGKYHYVYDDSINKFSITLRYEDIDNIKLYLSDSVHPIMMFNIVGSNIGNAPEDFVIYPQIQLKKPIFNGLTMGSLNSGLVQYSYRFYNKHGRATEVSTTTKLIPIINVKKNSDAKRTFGYAEGKDTNCGVKLKFDTSCVTIALSFSNMLIYRIEYIENGQEPTISLIYDSVITSEFCDTGASALSTLTLDEYNSISGIHFIPKMIESKNDYLFAANIKEVNTTTDLFKSFDARAFQFGYKTKTSGRHLYVYDSYQDYTSDDNTYSKLKQYDPSGAKDWPSLTSDCFNPYNDINKEFDDVNQENVDYTTSCLYRSDIDGYWGGTGPNISWRFIVTEIPADTHKAHDLTYYGKCGSDGDCIEAKALGNPFSSQITASYIKNNGNLEHADDINASEYFQSEGQTSTYGDAEVSYYLKSLRRDELYRYGIILYDKTGYPSPVKWIADIRTPNITYKGFEDFVSHAYIDGNCYDLAVRPLGIRFTVNIPDELKDEVSSYEIVRCNRKDADICTLSQGVVSRPIKRYLLKDATVQNYPYTPTGLLTTSLYQAGEDWNQNHARRDTGLVASNIDNDNLFQFVSPEISYTKETFKTELSEKTLNLMTQLYVWGQCGSIDNLYKKTGESYGPSDDYRYDFYCPSSNSSQTDSIDSVTHYRIMHPSQHNLNLYLNSNGFSDNTSDHVKYNKSGADTIYNNSDLSIISMPYNMGSSIYCNNAADKNQSGDEQYQAISNIDGTKIANEDWKKIMPLAYAYVKMYNRTDTIEYRTNYKYDTFLNIKDDIHKKDLASVHWKARDHFTRQTYTVSDTAFSEDGAWDKFYTSTTADGKTTYTINATNLASICGQYEYVNWVFGGSYGASSYWMDDKPIDTGYGKTRAEGNMIGPSGSCMLLQVDSPDQTNRVAEIGPGYIINRDNVSLLSDTICSKCLLQNESNNNLSNQISKSISGLNIVSKTEKINKNYCSFEDSDLDALGCISYSDNYGYNCEFYRDSIAGTYICNLRQKTIPYGGYDIVSRSLNTYYSYGDSFDISNSNADVFDGDCFICPFEYQSFYKYYDTQVGTATTSTAIIYSIPVETNMNLYYTLGDEWSRIHTTKGATNLQLKASKVYDQFVQQKDEYAYNTAYSCNQKTRVFSSYNDKDNDKQDNTDFRCYYSGVKTNDEYIDNWCKFQSSNYLDVDTRYGAITDIRTFHNDLIFWQEFATGKFSVNERSLITDNTNQSLILGTGGVLSRYDYLDNVHGMKDGQFADIQSSDYLYWFDDCNQEVRQYSGQQIIPLSKAKGVQSIMNKYDKNTNPILMYDKQYNEVLFNVLKDKSLVYSEQLSVFTSLYDIPFTGQISFENGEYIINNSNDLLKIGQWNSVVDNKPNSWSNTIQTYINYIVNPNPLETKVFDNQEIVTVNKLGATNDNKYDINRFTTNYNYTWATDINKTDESNLVMTNRESNYRYSIPRANHSLYGDRIRGKYMSCEMTSTINDYDTSISYIITKFRKSWS